MKRKTAYILFFALFLVFPACLPEKRVEWSRDGQSAIVKLDQKTFLLKMSHPDTLLPVPENINRLTWFPDSKHLLAVETDKMATWEKFASRITPQEQKHTIDLAERVHTEVLQYKGKWDDFDPQTEMTESETKAVCVYLRDVQKEDLRKVIGKRKWQDLQGVMAELYALRVYEYKDNRIEPGKAIFGDSIEFVFRVVISPDGDNIAFLKSERSGNIKDTRLYVIPRDGSSSARHVDNGALHFDWTADGRHLVYTHSRGPVDIEDKNFIETIVLGTITEMEVCDNKGKLLDKFEKRKDLAGILLSPFSEIQRMQDGRILFSSLEANLPASTNEGDPSASLFVLDPQRYATLINILTPEIQERAGQGIAMGAFDISPDDKHICILSEDDVFVYTIATGEIEEVPFKEKPDDKVENIPTWRNADEISFFAPAGSKWAPEREELILWSISKKEARCISKDWPRKSPETKPSETRPSFSSPLDKGGLQGG
ncbi:MAG: TolB family protein [Planctomycetota bacterium]|jgi:hypothetical protein